VVCAPEVSAAVRQRGGAVVDVATSLTPCPAVAPRQEKVCSRGCNGSRRMSRGQSRERREREGAAASSGRECQRGGEGSMGALSIQRHDAGWGGTGPACRMERWARRGAAHGASGKTSKRRRRSENRTIRNRRSTGARGWTAFHNPTTQQPNNPNFYLLILSTNPSSRIRIEYTHSYPSDPPRSTRSCYISRLVLIPAHHTVPYRAAPHRTARLALLPAHDTARASGTPIYPFGGYALGHTWCEGTWRGMG
jgi:hypothetical protein